MLIKVISSESCLLEYREKGTLSQMLYLRYNVSGISSPLDETVSSTDITEDKAIPVKNLCGISMLIKLDLRA